METKLSAQEYYWYTVRHYFQHLAGNSLPAPLSVMNKTDLLDHVIRLDNSPHAAVKMAWHTLTDERIARRQADAKTALARVQNRLNLFNYAAGGIASLAIFAFVYEHWAIRSLAIATGLLSCAVTVMGLGVVRLVAERMSNTIGAGLTSVLLAPARGTVYGELAVKALTTGGQMTSLWREVALQERSQLHVFDVLILDALGKAEWAAAAPGREVELLTAAPRHNTPVTPEA